MSDLTRLNPTPHAIAVYASQPLSPVATQHSLPSRTLPFTWAGLSPAGSHQLCLAHSLDHRVGTQRKCWRNVQSEHPRGLEIDDQLIFRRRLDRQVGRLLAFQDASDVHADLMIAAVQVRAVAHQAGRLGKFPPRVNRRHAVARSKRDEPLALERFGSLPRPS